MNMPAEIYQAQVTLDNPGVDLTQQRSNEQALAYGGDDCTITGPRSLLLVGRDPQLMIDRLRDGLWNLLGKRPYFRAQTSTLLLH